MHIRAKRLLSAIAVGTVIATSGVTSVGIASAQISVVAESAETSTVAVISAETDDENSADSGSTVKWVLISAGAGLALGGIIAGVQAYLRRRNDPKPNDRYRR